MDERDDWLEGVRRWYFGGDAPADATPDELAWPRADSAERCGTCAHRAPLPPAVSLLREAGAA